MGHATGIQTVGVAPDGTWLITGSYDRTIRVWDTASGQQVAWFIADAPIRACAIAEDDTVVAGDDQGRVYFLRLVRGLA
jgi:WD40 repeat protein